MRGLSLVAASGGHSSSRCAGPSPLQPLPLRSTGYRRAGSVVVVHGLSCSAACGILPDQGSNPCPLHWQADSQPLRHQGSPQPLFLTGNDSSLEPRHFLFISNTSTTEQLAPFWDRFPERNGLCITSSGLLCAAQGGIGGPGACLVTPSGPGLVAGWSSKLHSGKNYKWLNVMDFWHPP